MEWDEYFDSAAKGRRPTSDFEWYAVDDKGQVALLTSAGFGAIPLQVFLDRDIYYSAREYFNSLPHRCGSKLFVNDSSNLSSWRDVVHRGLFSYDWSNSAGQYTPGKPYTLIAAPQKPITLFELPTSVAEYVSPIRFHVNFEEAMDLYPEQEFEEVNLF
ncbi:MAG TPA: hypothetical protein VKE98_22455 [Gemmataceae bacterium]|nr:hypothetical protein [Gemmataceae bacterium]